MGFLLHSFYQVHCNDLPTALDDSLVSNTHYKNTGLLAIKDAWQVYVVYLWDHHKVKAKMWPTPVD